MFTESNTVQDFIADTLSQMGWKDIRSLEEAMAEDVLNSAEVVCCTCIGAGHMILGNKKFSNILIDEATFIDF